MKKQILLTIITALFSISTLAGGNHFHPKKIAKCEKECTEEQIKTAVPSAITYLADWKRIDATWSKAKIESVGKKEFKKGPEWVVTLKNEANEVRYVFFGLDGFVTGSNSTGE